MRIDFEPIVAGPEQWGSGWVSPEGQFYRCDWAQHDEAARQLLEIYGAGYEIGQKSAPYGVHLLETKGWIRLTKDGTVCVFDGMKDSTEAQSARLVDIALAAFNADKNWFGPIFAAELNRFLNPEVADEIEEPPSPFG